MRIIKFLLIIVLLYSCTSNEGNDLNYAGFENNAIELGVPIAGEKMYEVKVYTTSISSSDRTFNVSVVEDGTTADAGAYTVAQTVTVPGNSNEGSIAVNLKDLNIGEEGKKITLSLTSSDSNIFLGENIEITVVQLCELNQVFLNIEFDTYPEEVYWRIRDAAGNTVAESKTPAGFGAYDGFEGKLLKKLCLPDGTYLFQVFDGYSDGAGPISLSYDGNALFSSDGAYGAGTQGTFTVPN